MQEDKFKKMLIVLSITNTGLTIEEILQLVGTFESKTHFLDTNHNLGVVNISNGIQTFNHSIQELLQDH